MKVTFIEGIARCYEPLLTKQRRSLMRSRGHLRARERRSKGWCSVRCDELNTSKLLVAKWPQNLKFSPNILNKRVIFLIVVFPEVNSLTLTIYLVVNPAPSGLGTWIQYQIPDSGIDTKRRRHFTANLASKSTTTPYMSILLGCHVLVDPCLQSPEHSHVEVFHWT